MDSERIITSASRRFLDCVKARHGDKKATEVMEAVRSVLGQQWSDDIILSILQSPGNVFTMRIYIDFENPSIAGFDPSNYRSAKIHVVKAMRALSNDLGLKEAVDLLKHYEGDEYLDFVVNVTTIGDESKYMAYGRFIDMAENQIIYLRENGIRALILEH